MLEEALEMRGGGPFRLEAGQITDDSELAISLLRGLESAQWKFDVEEIAKFYRVWYQSLPFDIGITTRQAFKGPDLFKDKSPAEAMTTSAETFNQESLSNGFLMRVSPLAIFAARK